MTDANPGATCLVIDGASIVHLDSTGADTLVVLADELATRGMRVIVAGALPQIDGCWNGAARSNAWAWIRCIRR